MDWLINKGSIKKFALNCGGLGQILLSLQALNPQKIPLTNIVNDEIKLDKDAKVLGFWEGLTFK